MTVSYQEYLEAHLPADTPETSYNPIYMASKTLYGQLESDTGFFDPNNLLTLSKEDLGRLNTTVENEVIGQLQRDIGSYENSHLRGEGDPAAAAAYTERYAEYQGTLAMGLVHERFVTAGMPAEDVADSIRGAIDDFSARFTASMDNTMTLHTRISDIAAELDSRGMDALAYYADEIEALPENGKSQLREAIEESLQERLENSPEEAEQIQAFQAELDERIADITPDDPSAPTSPTPQPDMMPGTP